MFNRNNIKSANKKIKGAAAFFICLILAGMLSLNSFAGEFKSFDDVISIFQQNQESSQDSANQSVSFEDYINSQNLNSQNIINKFEHKFDPKYKNYYSAVKIDDEIKKLINEKSLNPQLDEMLDAYAEVNLYNLNREQAVNLMIKSYLLNNSDAVAEMGNSLLTAIDPFGGYYAQTTAAELFGNVYTGYGIVFDGKKMDDGNLYNTIVKKVAKNSPALNAGIKAGDEIIKINGINVENLGLIAVSDLLSAVDNKVELTVRRSGTEMKFTMSKDTVYISSITFQTIGEKNDTALITIEDFTDGDMVNDFFMILNYLQQEKYKNLILDLRNNLGGDMYSMAEILNVLVPDKDVSLFSYEDKNGDIETLKSTGGGMAFDKICVLTNGYTASASEIFALSLSEITGAVIIGEKTYGKGVAQLYGDLSNGDLIGITAFEIISSKGTSYHKAGIEPAIKIAPKYTNAKNNKFDQLNFVNCVDIKKDADNKAVLALNQRLARIGYLSTDDITSKCTDKTITAIEIFQKYNGLPVGISKIDYLFIDYLNFYVSYSDSKYQEQDVQLECAKTYIEKDKKAAENYVKSIK